MCRFLGVLSPEILGQFHGPVGQVDVKVAVGVVVGERRPADDVADGMKTRAGGDICERSVAVVAVEPGGLELAPRIGVVDHDEVEEPVAVEVGEVGDAAQAQVPNSSDLRHVREPSPARGQVVAEQAIREAVVPQQVHVQVTVPVEVAYRRSVTHVAQHDQLILVLCNGRTGVVLKHEAHFLGDIDAR